MTAGARARRSSLPGVAPKKRERSIGSLRLLTSAGAGHEHGGQDEEDGEARHGSGLFVERGTVSFWAGEGERIFQ